MEPARFRQAVAYLCRKPLEKSSADEVLAASREAGVDPFLLAALMSERSRCDVRKRNRGYGLLAIQPAMYASPGAPKLPVHPSELTASNLLHARANLGVGARLLRMWQEQHDAIDLAFPSVAHRSAVSHFMWGDTVLASGNEDLVLTSRRRLLDRYNQSVPEPKLCELGMAVVPPLEAHPRVATSGPGDDRDGGARRHRGLDVVASPGEPVRAIADGTVIFSGANLKGNPRRTIPPKQIGRYARASFGAGGIYVCVRHAASTENPRGPVSCYMHLERYSVAAGDKVRAGQTIGVVGRTGVTRSPPHLHLEVRVDDRFKDPARYFSESIIPPRETLTHQLNARTQRARLRAAARANRATVTAVVRQVPRS